MEPKHDHPPGYRPGEEWPAARQVARQVVLRKTLEKQMAQALGQEPRKVSGKIVAGFILLDEASGELWLETQCRRCKWKIRDLLSDANIKAMQDAGEYEQL